MSKRPLSLSLPLILLVGFALRLYRLGVQSLWYDETVSAILARQSIPALIAHTARDIHPPGYYLLLHGWTRLVGESEFALAYLSLIFGMLLIAGVYLLGRTFLKAPAGLWAAGLVALSPYQLWYSQEVRMYTLGAFLGVLMIYCVFKAIAQALSPSKPGNVGLRWWIGYALAATAGLYTLYYFAFLLIPLNLYTLVILLGYRRRGSAWLAWLIANLAVIVLYLPWLGTAWRQVTQPPVPPWRSGQPLLQILLESWSALSFGEAVQPGQIWPLLLVTAGLFILGLYVLRSRRLQIALPLLVFGPLAIIVFAPLLGLTDALYHVRYVFTYSPLFYLILAAALAWLGRHQIWGAVMIALLLLGGSLFSIQQFHHHPLYASDDFRSAVNLIETRWRPGDVILVNAGYTYPAFQYYYRGPTADYRRLSQFTPSVSPADRRPLVLETGTVNGSATLGWGLSESDFYALSRTETITKLEAVTNSFPRLWLLRIYDTQTDPSGVIRDWLSQNMLPFEDQTFTGTSNMRVQGFMSQPPPPPPQSAEFTLEDKFILQGFTPPAASYQPGDTIDVALWWQAQKSQPTAVPRPPAIDPRAPPRAAD
jgi:hypothetical protein